MTLSVIIPVFNEARIIADTIKTINERSANPVNIIVVDGGSEDETCRQAKAAGAEIISSPRKGRAAQMNVGAEHAVGDLLYFLHADSLPPQHFDQKIEQAYNRGYVSGCFQLAFDGDSKLLDIYAWFTRFDIDAFRFGDQSLFIVKDSFEKIGGFREDHLVMEDNEIVRRIKKQFSFIILDDKVETSGRAYRQGGELRLQIIFIIIVFLYHCGVSQEILAHLRARATQ